MSENSYVTKASEISIRYANYSSEIRAEFNRRVGEINTENLLTPKWLHRSNRKQAYEIMSRVEGLLDELLELYKAKTLSWFNELTKIDEDISPDRKSELLAKYLKSLNESSFQVGGFFSLVKTQFTLTKELFDFFENRDRFIDIDADEIVFEYDEDIDIFNNKVEELTLVFNHTKRLSEINEDKMRKLAENVGIFEYL